MRMIPRLSSNLHTLTLYATYTEDDPESDTEEDTSDGGEDDIQRDKTHDEAVGNDGGKRVSLFLIMRW